MAFDTEVLIVGGGLAGMSLARKLFESGVEFQLVEARPRLGGRIKTECNHGGYFDLGPAWFWQGQPRILSLVRDLGLASFEQYSTGILTYEDERGQVQRDRGYASMAGSLRLQGGLMGLIDALAAKLPESSYLLNTPVQEIRTSPNGIVATVIADGKENAIHVRHIVLCIPPRVAAKSITCDPPLPAETVHAMDNVSTWMAGQAKAMAIYDTPFWRDAGLSGDAMSRAGPMIEVHDASPRDVSSGALFGFVGVPAQERRNEKALREAVLQQFIRLFGDEAANPKELIIKDWAFDPRTATSLDHAPVYAHPHYGLPETMNGLMDGRLMFGSTEIASEFGGYLEGALEAAENVVGAILKHRHVDAASVSAQV